MSIVEVLKQHAYACRIEEVSNEEWKMSDFLIGRFREDIIRALYDFRLHHVDVIARKSLKEQGPERVTKYPIGECSWIRNRVLDHIKRATRSYNPDMPWVSPMIVRFRPVYGIQGEKTFQNAIQAGNWIIDWAKDTVDRTRYPVTVLHVHDSWLRNMHNHADFADVFERYQWVQSFPNVYYPNLAPFFPIIFVDIDGSVWFGTNMPQRLDMMGIFEDFQSAENFIFDSDFANRRLTKEQQSKLKSMHPWNTLNTEDNVSLDAIRIWFKQARWRSVEERATIYQQLWNLIEKSPLRLWRGL